MNWPRSLWLVLNTVSLILCGAAFADAVEEDEEAVQASIRQIQTDLSPSATVPAALAVVEGTVDGGRARAGFELLFRRTRLHLRLETAFKDVKESDFITLEQLPGDASIQANLSFELSRESPEALLGICKKLNAEVHDLFDRERGSRPPVVRQSLPKEPSLDELYTYVRDLETQLIMRSGDWEGRVDSATSVVVEALCLDWNKQHPGSSPILPEILGVRDLMERTASELCTSSNPAVGIADRFKNAGLCSVLALDERAGVEGAIQGLGEALKPYFSHEELPPFIHAKVRPAIEESQCAAIDAARAGFRQSVDRELQLMNSTLSSEEREDFVNDLESELVRSRVTPWRFSGVLGQRLRLACPSDESSGPRPIPGMPPRTQRPGDDSVCKARASAAGEAAYRKWREEYRTKFSQTLRQKLVSVLPTGAQRDLESLATAAEVDLTKGSSEFLKTFLGLLRVALDPVAEEFNAYPVAKMFLTGNADCRYEKIEAAFNAREPGPERNKLFREISKSLPSVSYLTILSGTAAKDFSWLKVFPPALDEDNQVALTKDRKYNFGAGISYTLFLKGWTYEGTAEEREVFDAGRSAEVCVDLSGESSSICKTAALKAPTGKQETVLSIGAKYFFTPTRAVRLFTSYETKNDVLNPHVFIYFIPEKGVLRGGLDLSYIRHHPMLGNQFQGRLFFGVPIAFGPDKPLGN